MNILLWLLQVLLAFHTVTGAGWKFSHTAQETMPSLGAIPDPAWLALGALELVAGLALVVPAMRKSLGRLVPVAAVFIAAEMLLDCGLHLVSGGAAAWVRWSIGSSWRRSPGSSPTAGAY